MEASAPRLRIGVSRCLLGAAVRYDGGHKRDLFLVDTLGQFADFVAVCPEVEVGMGIPREAVHLVRDRGVVRMVGLRTVEDHTPRMAEYVARRARELEAEDLDGFVFKRDSPSCGLYRVPIFRPVGAPLDGRGLFAAAVVERMPLLPVEEEGRLRDPVLREAFIERVFAWRRLRDRLRGRFTIGQLVAFHAREKLLLLAHDRKQYEALGRLVARAKGMPRAELVEKYSRGFMAALAKPATRGRNCDVLQHVLGYFRRHLDDADRGELRALVEDYRRGLVPLVVPVTLVRHHVRRLGIEYLDGQTWLEPSPKELMLRNHA